MNELLRPGRGAEYCDQFICLCVSLSVCLSVREHISGTAGLISTKFVAQIPCGRGSVLFWQRCDTLRTSGFMDDVMFGDAWLAALRYRVECDVYECLVVIFMRENGMK